MFSFFIGAFMGLITSIPDTASSSLQNAPATATISVEFDNIIGGKQVQLNTGQYTNIKGESFTISLLQYYISNLVFIKADGTQYIVPQDSSYFLIKEADPATRYARVKVPEGEYTGLQFVLGVDSVRSTKDISERNGVVDVEKVFNGEEQLSIAAHPTVMFSPYSVKIANNFPAMFRHDHTENK